jgi:TP901 family phage tail tape measure protein
MPSRNNIEIVISATDNASTTLGSVGTKLQQVGSGLSNVGGAVMTVSAPLAGAFGLAVKQAADFDESVTNTGAVLGLTRQQIVDLKAKLLDVGAGTRAGPQAVADSFYDIVGGVADASTHMDILNASIHTSQAGNSDLAGTTKALISVMNAYKFKAKDASVVSDVLTQTVNKGVGTMDDFASAFPQVTGLAAKLNIGFDDLGGMMAYLTTQGNSASESATQLSGMMIALLKPSDQMKKGLQELGFSSGSAAIQALGLSGAWQALAGTQAASGDGMALMAGRVEALRGVTSLAGADVGTFMNTFTTGVQGATQAAEQIQLGSAAAQFDLLKSSVDKLGITAGTALTPALLDIVKDMTPVVNGVSDWIAKNPEATKTIGELAFAIFGAGLAAKVLGGLIGAGGTIVAGITAFSATTLGGLLIEIGVVAAALIALKLLFDQVKTYQQQIKDAQLTTTAALAPQIQSGAITKQQYQTQAFASAQSQFGDLGARLFYALGGEQTLMQPYNAAIGLDQPANRAPGDRNADLQKAWLAVQNAGGASSGGSYNPGKWQIVPGSWEDMASKAAKGYGGFGYGGYTGDTSGIAGFVHGGEWVVPENGALVLRGDGGGQGGGITINGPVNVYANDANSFRQSLVERARAMG